MNGLGEQVLQQASHAMTVRTTIAHSSGMLSELKSDKLQYEAGCSQQFGQLNGATAALQNIGIQADAKV
jgi:hypothetical protein